MSKLIIKLLILLTMTAVSCSVIIFSAPKNEHSYLYALIDKKKMLESTTSPRIILVGGSNLAFGIDSQRIHKETGFQVVNLGLHAGVGLKYILNEVKPYIRPKDIIILIPEYENYFDNSLNGEQVLVQLLTSMPQEIKNLDSKQLITAMKYTPSVLYDTLESEIRWVITSEVFRDPIYNRDGFNRYGDLVTHLNRQSKSVNGKLLSTYKSFNSETIKCINDFAKLVDSKGARIYYMFPPIPENSYIHEKIDIVYREIKTNLIFQVLGTPYDYVLPQNYFFDTLYHLNNTGRSVRTAKVIGALNKIILNRE